MRAGVFDSGVGGLSVVKSLMEHGLFEEIIYYGDTARVPYGTKDKNTIIRYSLEALEFFKNFDIDVVIAACNSVSSYAIEELRANSKVPVFGVIEPGVKALANKITNKEAKILILGTKATVSSGKYDKFLREEGYLNIDSLAPTLFVPIVEEGIFEGEILDSAMKFYFQGLQKPDALILGCTHFPLIAKEIGKYFEGSILIHSGEAIVEHLQKNLNFKTKFDKTSLQLFASDSPEGLKKTAQIWLK